MHTTAKFIQHPESHHEEVNMDYIYGTASVSVYWDQVSLSDIKLMCVAIAECDSGLGVMDRDKL